MHGMWQGETGLYHAPVYDSIARGVAAGLHYPWAAIADDQVHALLKVSSRALQAVPLVHTGLLQQMSSVMQVELS